MDIKKIVALIATSVMCMGVARPGGFSSSGSSHEGGYHYSAPAPAHVSAPAPPPRVALPAPPKQVALPPGGKSYNYHSSLTTKSITHPSTYYHGYTYHPYNYYRPTIPVSSARMVHSPYTYGHFPYGTRVVNHYYYYNNYYYGHNGYYGYSPYGWYYSPYGSPWWWIPTVILWAGALANTGPVIINNSPSYTPNGIQAPNEVNVIANAQPTGPTCPIGTAYVSSYLGNARSISIGGYGTFNAVQSSTVQGWYITVCIDDPSDASAFGQKLVTVTVR